MMDFEKGTFHTHKCDKAGPAIVALIQATEKLLPPAIFTGKRKLEAMSSRIQRMTKKRQAESYDDKPYDSEEIARLAMLGDKEDTVLYLAYGSNLSAETFLGKRGIKPLSQANVVAPSIALTFDLPGLPYTEPCFANSKYRNEPASDLRPPYHKNAWKKGLVGVVYEVTKQDYAHIIATEGGGSGYHDVLVDCHTLDDDVTIPVPEAPSGTPFKAHTLYAHKDRSLREDPDYAQPSARYLKLITDGAKEHSLPDEYQQYLANIRYFQATTTKQRIGGYVFLSIWGPILLFFFGGAKIFLRKDGTYPKWFAAFAPAVFTAVWASYDGMFKNLFGDGERTMGEDDDHGELDKGAPNEKMPLLVEQTVRVAV